MKQKMITVISAEILDDRNTFSLSDLCHVCDVHAEFLIDLIEHGVIEPAGATMSEWEFDSFALKRAKSAVRLQHDFSLNSQAIALILDLTEELQRLREKLDLLEKQGF